MAAAKLRQTLAVGSFGCRATVSIGAICLVTMSRTAPAQIVGRISDPAGAPIAGATVAVWEGGIRRGIAQSRDDGYFIIRAGDGQPLRPTRAWTLGARHLGYLPFVMRLVDDTDSVRVVLSKIPVELPPVLARVEAHCPQDDAPAARAIWRAAASRYARNTRALPLWWQGDEALDEVPPEQLGSPSRENLVSKNQYQISGYTRKLLGADIPPVYAARLDPITQSVLTAGGRYHFWRYAELEGFDAPHFIEEDFGRLHDFSVAQQTQAGTVVVFCTARSQLNVKQQMEGTLTFSSDSTLVSATWRFITPKPHENAGGEAMFGVAEFNHEQHLVSLQGLFWRRMEGRKEYVQRWLSVREWGILQSSLTGATPPCRTAASPPSPARASPGSPPRTSSPPSPPP